jgi:SulP family sulfate permease
MQAFFKTIPSYSWSFFRKDCAAAGTIALLAIPQSVAYALLAGLPAFTGICAAIFGMIFTAGRLSSKHLVPGSSTGMAIVLQTMIFAILYRDYPTVVGEQRERLVLDILLHIVFWVGLFQILASLCKINKLLQFISKPVMLGYFSGVACVIIIQQILGIFSASISAMPASVLSKIVYFFQVKANMGSIIVGFLSMCLFYVIRKHCPKIPHALLILVLMTAVSFVANRYLFFQSPIPTLVNLDAHVFIGQLIHVPYLSKELLQNTFVCSLVMALLGLLEVFSVSRQITYVQGSCHSASKDILLIGCGNLLMSLFLFTMPLSVSISKSLASIEAGCRTSFYLLLAGMFMSIMVCFLWPFIQYVPLASLSAIIIFGVMHVFDKEQIKLCFRATKEDALCFIVTLSFCFFLRLDWAFLLGIGLSIFCYLKKAADLHYEEYAFDRAGRLSVVTPTSSMQRQVRIIGIRGELFFGVVDVLHHRLRHITDDPRVKILIIRFYGVYHIDASTCFAMLKLHEYLCATKRELLLSGLNEQSWRVLQRAGVAQKIGIDHFFMSDSARPQLSTWKACMRAQEILTEKDFS